MTEHTSASIEAEAAKKLARAKSVAGAKARAKFYDENRDRIFTEAHADAAAKIAAGADAAEAAAIADL